MPEAYNILREFITVQSRYRIHCNICANRKVKAMRSEMQFPFFVWILSEMSDNCNATAN